MSDRSERETEECTFTWRVENLLWNAFDIDDGIESPTFRVPLNGSNTEWGLRLYLSRSRHHIVCYLHRMYDGEPREVSVGYELVCVTADENIKSAHCREQATFSRDNFSKCEWKWRDLLEKRSLYFPNGCFTVWCRLWTASPETKPCLEYVAVTHIKATIISNRKRILASKALGSDYEIKCSLLPRNELEIILFRKENSDYISVRIHCRVLEIEENIKLSCKLTVLDSRGIALHKVEEMHLFQYTSNDFCIPYRENQIFDEEIWSLQHCIKLEELIKKMNTFTDVLNFEFEFVMGTRLVESHIIDTKTFQPRNSILISDVPETEIDSLICKIETFYTEKKYVDVQLKSGKEMFPAHKVVLCIRSPVFAAMFNNDMAERKCSVIEIEDVDAPTLDKLLFFMYTEQLKNMKEDMAMKLLTAADKYQIISLKEKCAIFLQKRISAKNACQILQLAGMHQVQFLNYAAQDFICHNHRFILPSDEWKQLTKNKCELASEIIQRLSAKYSDA